MKPPEVLAEVQEVNAQLEMNLATNKNVIDQFQKRKEEASSFFFCCETCVIMCGFRLKR
jgi:hypothetical protein